MVQERAKEKPGQRKRMARPGVGFDGPVSDAATGQNGRELSSKSARRAGAR